MDQALVNKYILKPGEVYCHVCNGTGIIKIKVRKAMFQADTKMCSHCKGYGTVTWIENIVGVRNNG